MNLRPKLSTFECGKELLLYYVFADVAGHPGLAFFGQSGSHGGGVRGSFAVDPRVRSFPLNRSKSRKIPNLVP